MYRLFQRIPKGLEPIADTFKKHVEGEGMKLVKEVTDALANKKDKEAGASLRSQSVIFFLTKYCGLCPGACKITINILSCRCGPHINTAAPRLPFFLEAKQSCCRAGRVAFYIFISFKRIRSTFFWGLFLGLSGVACSCYCVSLLLQGGHQRTPAQPRSSTT